jgi:hypothetical protein
MKLDTVNGLVTFIGKPSEAAKIEKALAAMEVELEEVNPAYFGDLEDESEIDYGFVYNMDAYTVEDVKAAWRKVKATI